MDGKCAIRVSHLYTYQLQLQAEVFPVNLSTMHSDDVRLYVKRSEASLSPLACMTTKSFHLALPYIDGS